MGDLMRPVSFKELVNRMFSEYQKDGKIFGIAEAQFFKKEGGNQIIDFWRELRGLLSAQPQVHILS